MIAKELGWIGFAADIYGTKYHADVGTVRHSELAEVYRNDNALFANRIQATVDFVKTLPSVDPTRIALAGYGFGGNGVLTYALFGLSDVAAIVSLNGNHASLPVPGTAVIIRPKLLVLSSGDDNDDTAADIMHLEKVLNSAKANWEISRFKELSGITFCERPLKRLNSRRRNPKHSKSKPCRTKTLTAPGYRDISPCP
jgi:dienelactone hydrolase